VADREWTLRYPGRCRTCGAELPAGTRARWDSDTKRVTCLSCASRPRPDPAGAAPRPVGAPPGPAAEGPARGGQPQPAAQASPWRRLVDYHLRAVALSASQPPPLITAATWRALPLREERIVTGRGDELAVGPELADLFANCRDDEVVLYGWPALVVQDREGRARVAPLAVTPLQPPAVGERVCVPSDDVPHLHTGLLTDEFLPPELLSTADTRLSFGDAAATVRSLRELLVSLGVPTDALEPGALDPSSLTSSARLGVHNTAVALRVPNNLATRALAEELRQLRDRTDWGKSAVRWLLEGAPVADPGSMATTSVASPTDRALNDGQEQALVSAADQPLTLVVGPPGTGKSELVVATVADAWLRDETVLVASTNNGAVQVAVERATSVDPGLLLRTGNREHRDALPGVLEELLARPQPLATSPALVRRALDVAARERSDRLKVLSRRTTTEAALAGAARRGGRPATAVAE
jgi:hypothetical protein